MRAASSIALAAILAVSAHAQQPNTPNVASLIFAGVDGPTYPNIVNFSSTVIGMDLQGAPGAPFILVSAGVFPTTAGLLATGIPTGFGLVDIDFTGGFTVIVNGVAPTNFFEALARMDPTGNSNWTLPVPVGGHLGAFQALMVDATNPNGFTLTAASDVTVTVAQNLVLTGGDDAVGNLPLSFGTANFYNVAYNNVFVTTNGNMTFGVGDGDFTPTAAEFTAGAPRIAPLWCDLLPGFALGGAPFIGNFIEDAGSFTFRWIGQNNYTGPGAATTVGAAGNTFSVTFDYAGVHPLNPTLLPNTVILDYATAATGFGPPIPAAVQANWGLIGITPGGNLSPTPQAFNPAVTPSGAGGTGLTAVNALDSYLADFGTPGTLPNPVTAGTIVFSPFGFPNSDFYALF